MKKKKDKCICGRPHYTKHCIWVEAINISCYCISCGSWGSYIGNKKKSLTYNRLEHITIFDSDITKRIKCDRCFGTGITIIPLSEFYGQ